MGRATGGEGDTEKEMLCHITYSFAWVSERSCLTGGLQMHDPYGLARI